MGEEQITYEQYFTDEMQVSIGIQLANNRLHDDTATVAACRNGRLSLELFGSGLSPEMQISPGADVIVSARGGWGIYRCNGMFEGVSDLRHIDIRLVGKVDEQQRREFFRLDVEIPVVHSLSAKQNLQQITRSWEEMRTKNLEAGLTPVIIPHGEGFKVFKWRGGADILPLQANLSGGGIRFKMPEYAEPGSFVNLELFLPLAPSRLINVVAKVVRSREVSLELVGRNRFITAMEFCCIDDKDRETIISYLFTEQRRQRRGEKELEALGRL